MAEQIITLNDLIKMDEYTYEIPKSYRKDMRVPARVFVNSKMIDDDPIACSITNHQSSL